MPLYFPGLLIWGGGVDRVGGSASIR